MNMIWDEGDRPPPPKLDIATMLRIARRALALFFLVFGCLVVLLLLRLVERPVHGVARPWTPHITQFVCRNAFRLLGLPLHVEGTPMRQRGVVVANHTSWLDIFALNASKRIYFVSKSEVAGWPGIGWLARATGTVFIERNRLRARQQAAVFETRLQAGHRLLFFPEGTSTDGFQVLPFKTTLFQPFFNGYLRDVTWVQPVAVIYVAPVDHDRRFYAWWGDMSFGAHLVATLAPEKHGRVEVHYCAPLKVSQYQDRKTLALACEAAVRNRHNKILKDLITAGPEERVALQHRC